MRIRYWKSDVCSSDLRRSFNILYTNFPIPGSLGVNSLAAQNAAEMVNQGVELNLNFTNRSGALGYALGLNVTNFAKNEVTSLGSGVQTIVGKTITTKGETYKRTEEHKSELKSIM